MKIIILTLVMASAYAYPDVRTWTLPDLSLALRDVNPMTANEDPEYKPLIDAVDFMMSSLMDNDVKKDEVNIMALMISPTGSKLWTIDQLKNAVFNARDDPELMPFLVQAMELLIRQNSKEEGQKKNTTEVWIPALDISTWTHDEVMTTLKDPHTKQELIPYLKDALKKFDDAKDKGQNKENVTLITPVGLIPLPDGVIPTVVQRSTIVQHDNLMK